MDPNRTDSQNAGMEGNHEAQSSSPLLVSDQNAAAAKSLNLPPELENHPQYRVIKRIGRGGMGVLYLVEHRVTARKEALKIIHPHLLNQPGVRERFLREIQTAAKLNHPNVVQTLSAISDGNLLGLVMEYAPGESLQKLVARLGPLAPERALDFIAQAAEGLNHADELGMVHRDIKPSNLMITRTSDRLRVRILDFGLAKCNFESSDQKQMTQADNILGTPEYIAPEQALSPSKADIRADIYSLGCCLYFALTGQPPFVGETTLAVLHAHLIGDYKPILQLRPDLPKPIVQLQQLMMAKAVEQRIQSPQDLLVAIKKVARAIAKLQQATPQLPPNSESNVATITKESIDPSSSIAIASPSTLSQLVPADDTHSLASSPPREHISLDNAATPSNASPPSSPSSPEAMDDSKVDAPVAPVEATIDADELFQQLAATKPAPSKKSSVRSKSNRPATASVPETTTAIPSTQRKPQGVKIAGRSIPLPVFLTIVSVITLSIAVGIFAWSRFTVAPAVEPMAKVTIDDLPPEDIEIYINGLKATFKKNPSAAGWESVVKPGTTVISFQRDGKELKRQQTRLSSQQVFPLQSNFESILKSLDSADETTKAPEPTDSPPPASDPPAPPASPTPEP